MNMTYAARTGQNWSPRDRGNTLLPRHIVGKLCGSLVAAEVTVLEHLVKGSVWHMDPQGFQHRSRFSAGLLPPSSPGPGVLRIPFQSPIQPNSLCPFSRSAHRHPIQVSVQPTHRTCVPGPVQPPIQLPLPAPVPHPANLSADPAGPAAGLQLHFYYCQRNPDNDDILFCNTNKNKI